MDFIPAVFELLIPITGIIGTFLFVGILVWARQRRREREAYYRHELAKHLADKGADEEQLLRVLRQEGDASALTKGQGFVLGGLINVAIGVGMMIGLRWVDEGVAQLGWIPLLFGVALLVFGLVAVLLKPKATA